MIKKILRGMRLRYFFCVLASIFSWAECYSQDTYTWDDFVACMTSEEDSEYSSWTNFYEELCEIHENPYNINTATKEQLESLPFLSPQQVENILYYRYRYGAMRSLGELQLVKDMDFDTRHWLALFVYVGESEKKPSVPKLKNILKYGKQEVIARLDVPFYKKAGYQDYSDSILAKYPNRKYMGNPYYHSLRYSFRYGSKVFAGVTAEKDAGESFFGKGNTTYDYIAIYLFLKDIGRLNTLALGNYRLNYGQGLVMNTDFSLGKMATLSSMNSGQGIKKHSSTSESNAFRGIVVSYKLFKGLDADVFYSYKKLDANLTDSLFITSFKTDGYHRTPLEFSKKNNVTNELVGSHLTYSSKGFHLGLTGVYHLFNTQLKPADEAYKKYAARGNKFYNAGFDYAYHHHKFSLFGELSVGKGGGLATVNRVHWNALERLRLIFLYRHYTKDYVSLYANAFSESGDVQNEQGFYAGIEAKLSRTLKFNGYVDYFRFPWLRYQVSAPSRGWEAMGQLNWSPNRNINAFIKYRYKNKQKDAKDDNGTLIGLANRMQYRAQSQLNVRVSSSLSLQTNVYYNLISSFNAANDDGYLLLQSVSWKPSNKRLTLDANFSYFKTDSYDSRVYAYEKGLLYSFSYLSFYGNGMRLAATARMDCSSRLMLMMKYGHTKYFDRSTIGSNQEQINGSLKNDLYLQMRYKF